MTSYVALYCRISVDRAGRKEGVKAQERWGRAYAARVWPDMPVKVFADNDLSAAADDVVRPEYERLRAAIQRGEVAQVWAVEQYRVERREIPWFELAAMMDEAGIAELHTDRDGVVRVRDDVAGIKAVLGAGEVRRLKRRLNDALADKAAQGEPPGSRPFGYEHSTTEDGTKTYAIVAHEADVIRQVAEWVLSGWALMNIEAELERRGIRGAHGGKIHTSSIRSMVTVPTVAGYRVYRGEVVARGNWEPILDEQTWRACRLKLSQPRRVARKDGGTYPVGENHRGNSTGRRYLLTGGLIVCGVCQHRMNGALKQVKKRKVPYLNCHPNMGGKGCTGILLEKTEQFVVDELFTKLDRPEFLDAIASDAHAARRAELTKALDGIAVQRRELATLWATPGELTAEEWREARQGLNTNEQRLQRELSELPPPVIGVDIEGAREAWPEMTLDERREFVRLFIDKVEVFRAPPGAPRVFNSDRIHITWRTR